MASVTTRERVRLEECGDVLTIGELAAVLLTSVTTIKRRIRAGTLPIPPLRGIDRRYRWSRTDVERYLARKKSR